MPEEGLREIICNAIMHRDYMGTFIQMRVWADRIQLWNEGILPPSITIENLMGEHESKPRNPLIAKVFYLLGFVENWGRGYEKIRDSFEQAHLQVPTFEQVRGGFMATIQREVFQKVQNSSELNENKVNISVIAENYKLTKRQQKLLELINDNSRTTAEKIAQVMGVSSRTIQTELATLMKLKIIGREGSDKKGEYKILLPL
jgi:ATP-dependent DNA helicase RecG